jgi:dipeptidyl aminopeptidase/acylaminoacyl peptidase
VAVGTALFDKINNTADDLDISPVPRVLVLYYPVIDTSPNGFGADKIGARWAELSPLLNVRKGLPPTILFHGTADRLTPFKGAKAFQDTMLKAGNQCVLIVKEGGRHGYMMFQKKYYDEVILQTIKFLKDCGIRFND